MSPNATLIEGNKIRIISQNLFNYRKKNIWGKEQIEKYLKAYKADIYAFQEYPEWGRGKTFCTTFHITNNTYEEDISEVNKIWEGFFPWVNFPKRYWGELWIRFNNVRIIILNIHICSSYNDQLRLILLIRLEQLAGERVVLVGDFNAAFSYQTENVIPGNDIFFSKMKNLGYEEMLGNDEEDNFPHHTYALYNSKTKSWERKKLDHVFLSARMNEGDWRMRLEYIDDVNLNLIHINGHEPSNSFTDHSGLKLVIEAKNP